VTGGQERAAHCFRRHRRPEEGEAEQRNRAGAPQATPQPSRQKKTQSPIKKNGQVPFIHHLFDLFTTEQDAQ